MAEIHQEVWLSVNKPFGLEVIQARYAAAICRLEYAQKIIGKYIAREINNIEELEYRPLHTSSRYPIYNYLAFNGTLTIF